MSGMKFAPFACNLPFVCQQIKIKLHPPLWKKREAGGCVQAEPRVKGRKYDVQPNTYHTGTLETIIYLLQFLNTLQNTIEYACRFPLPSQLFVQRVCLYMSACELFSCAPDNTLNKKCMFILISCMSVLCYQTHPRL